MITDLKMIGPFLSPAVVTNIIASFTAGRERDLFSLSLSPAVSLSNDEERGEREGDEREREPISTYSTI